MFERFTDHARKAMAYANHEAHRWSCEALAPEHVLLGILKDGQGVACIVLQQQGQDLRQLRLEVEKRLSPATTEKPDRIPQSNESRDVVRMAIEEARNLNHDYCGSEHLMLGLLRLPSGIAADALRRSGVTYQAFRETLLALLGTGFEHSETAPPKNDLQHRLARIAAALRAAATELERIAENPPKGSL
jgi:ATP-dependent Clp protease ATP-binding subunit ClpC